MSVPSLVFRPARAGWLVAFLALACGPEPTGYQLEPSLNNSGGKGGGNGGGGGTTSDPTVTGVDPSFGRQGDLILGVRITGSGYDSSAEAAWERDGLPDPAVTVLATRFVSSTEVEADISIDGDADVDLYDVSVTNKSTGKRGVGIESFEVTTAVSVGSFCTTSTGHSQAFAVNDAGAVVGLSCDQALFWEAATGTTNLGPRVASGLDQAALMVVGQSSDKPVFWSRSAVGAAWSGPALLPANGWKGRGNTIVSDVEGRARLIGGRVDEPVKRNSTVGQPVMWFPDGAGWRLVILPRPSGVSSTTAFAIFGISDGGRAVSRLGPATVWEPAAFGSDQYTATLLPGSGGARGISPDGELIVGGANGVAAYWRRNADGTWSGPVALHAPCSNTTTYGWATGANNHGVIVGRGCNGGAAWRLAADGSVTEIRLPGFGKDDASQEAWGVNNTQPARAVGNGIKSAVYWDLPW
ncbi:MAG TPA: hypothetical protein VMK53_05955 [Gemmatimonadales bacterium]|nr:hypothetical protein [Gemmatimonadales bacterium]